MRELANVHSAASFDMAPCMPSSGGNGGGQRVNEVHAVPLVTRARSRAVAMVGPNAGTVGDPAALALLTPVERAALGLAALDDTLPPNGSSLLAAASGLAKLASVHVAR